MIQQKKTTTTVKTRFIVNSQQIIRVDEEDSAFINKNLEDRLIKKIDSYIIGKDVAVISDYNKGIITERISKYVIKKSNALNIPVIIDPKNEDFNIYRNATLITPNQLEVSKVTKLKAKSDKDAEACGKTIIKKYDIDKVLITRGEKGLLLVSKKASVYSPTAAKEVFDVSGAGDTVLAVIAACYPNKIAEKEIFDVSGAGDTVLAVIAACYPNKIAEKKILSLANKAAGKVVAKIGTSTISIDELIKNKKNNSKDKILDLKTLSKKIETDKEKGLKIGFTNGCFDILHYGHVKYLEKSKLYCDKLIVALNSDKSVKLIKGKSRPINNQITRASIISSLNCCDYIIIFDERTPLSLIKKIKPDLITKGGDYKNKKIVGESEIKRWGGTALKLDFINGLSSTNLIEKLEK
ncbi:MAG: D-glycero-beta-D-manno-heptose 1-phosphate adenylyltransferase [Pseudomonadota bacterium]|nr:D-glycero-beta-D-manno-heptose 1-phosphate adenylyltransferase [Pseudomonadota bacterium]